MNTPTPRTDAEHAQFPMGGFTLDFARQLERELTAAREELKVVTEQRDGIESKLRIELRGHPDSELWGEAGLIAATIRCVDAHDEATEQRDEWKAKYIQQNKDLGCEMMDPNGTIWDHAKKVQAELTAARAELCDFEDGIDKCMQETLKFKGERDRLAEALQQIANTDLYKCDDECAKLMYIASIHNAKQVLQSLNQPTEQTK